MTVTTVAARISELERHHRGLRAAARAVGIDAAYLARLKYGQRENPSDATLAKLGLVRVPAVYKRVTQVKGDR